MAVEDGAESVMKVVGLLAVEAEADICEEGCMVDGWLPDEADAEADVERKVLVVQLAVEADVERKVIVS